MYIVEDEGTPFEPLFDFFEPTTPLDPSVLDKTAFEFSKFVSGKQTVGSYELSISKTVKITTRKTLILNGIDGLFKMVSKEPSCLFNLMLCKSSGFALSLQIKVLSQLQENSYLFSSGGDRHDGTGMTLKYILGKIIVVFSTETDIWTVSLEKLYVGTEIRYAFSWSLSGGLAVYVDGKFYIRAVESVRRKRTVIVQHNIFTCGRNIFEGEEDYFSNIEVGRLEIYNNTYEKVIRTMNITQVDKTAAVAFYPLTSCTMTKDITPNSLDGTAIDMEYAYGPDDVVLGATSFTKDTSSIQLPVSGKLDFRASFSIFLHIYIGKLVIY